MITKCNFTAIIPARAGSKRLPNKNLMKLAGKSLLSYSIDAAKNSKYIDSFLISTDIPQNVFDNTHSKKCFVRDRPNQLAQDNALMSDVVLDAIHFLKDKCQIQPEYIILLQPTSPMRSEKHIDEACELLLRSPDFLSVISVFEPSTHPNKMFIVEKNSKLEPLASIKDLERPKQLLPKVYAQNGAIYIFKTSAFEKQKTFFIQPCMPYEMSLINSIDIDTLDDFRMAAFFLEN